MADGPGWSDAQWEKVQTAVTEAFNKASVAGSFLPCYGPLGANVESVRKEELSAFDGEMYSYASDIPDHVHAAAKAKLTVLDDETLKLFNLTVNVELSAQQLFDESLSSALLAFRRAATTLALVEDEIVFNGYVKPGLRPLLSVIRRVRSAPDDDPRTLTIAVKAPNFLVGLTEAPSADPFIIDTSLDDVGDEPDESSTGKRLVVAINRAIADLERQSHPGPFACVLDSALFIEAHRPERHSLVLPADRISPLLNGPLLRSGVMQKGFGIVVSLASNTIDLVVATPPKVQFLQTTDDARHIFRVYERFTLRHRDPSDAPVRTLKLEDAGRYDDHRQKSRERQTVAIELASQVAALGVMAAGERTGEAKAARAGMQDLGTRVTELERLGDEIAALREGQDELRQQMTRINDLLLNKNRVKRRR